MSKILMVSTSASNLKGHNTGLWIEELATPYYLFKEAGFTVDIASPQGGSCPIDANSMTGDFFTQDAKKFMHDAEAYGKLSHSLKLDTVDLSSYSALFCAGGHGTCVDFISNPCLKTAIESLFAGGKPVAAVCHGPMALVDCNKPDGNPLIQGMTVTGFSDAEEKAVQLEALVPFMLESRMKELGAKYEKKDDWNSNVCVDGNLITGQNPQSSEAIAKALVDMLKK